MTFILDKFEDAKINNDVERFYVDTLTNFSLFHKARHMAEDGNSNMKPDFHFDNIKNYYEAIVAAGEFLKKERNEIDIDVSNEVVKHLQKMVVPVKIYRLS